MPTGKHNDHPFAPGEPLTREQLLAYAEGLATPREQFLVELQLEHDPLLAEAMEGLFMPGAAESLKQLDRHRPGNGFNGGLGLITILIAITSIAVLLFHATPDDDLVLNDSTNSINEPTHHSALNDPQESSSAEDPIEMEEYQDPIKGTITDAPAEHFQRNNENTYIETDRPVKVDQLDPIALEPETIRTPVMPRPAARSRRPTGLQLHYLHDLKLIHPKELYPYDPTEELASGNLTADRSDREQVNILEEDLRSIDYLIFIEEALSHYANNEPAKCLKEMELILDQQPNDLNALFYAGICNFQLKNFMTAKRQLDLAAEHHFDVFHEEAIWYRAQTLEELGETSAARREFRRIAEAEGFYADRAKDRLK